MAVETIDGFNISKRDLTEEEANRDISFERFDEWQMEVGEDFCDQVGSMVDHYVFGGYLMAKHPEFSAEILKIIDKKNGEVLSYVTMFEEIFEDEEDANKKFYTLLAEFANLTKLLKKNINQILIQVMESKG